MMCRPHPKETAFVCRLLSWDSSHDFSTKQKTKENAGTEGEKNKNKICY